MSDKDNKNHSIPDKVTPEIYAALNDSKSDTENPSPNETNVSNSITETYSTTDNNYNQKDNLQKSASTSSGMDLKAPFDNIECESKENDSTIAKMKNKSQLNHSEFDGTIKKEDDPNAYLKQSENIVKGHWTGKFDYFLSTLGYAVGLGNVWRFPYMCFKYGGGAFLIPYLLSLVFLGIPMFLVDVSIGQFGSNGPFTCWEYAPIFTGIGYAMVTISTIVSIYYNVIIGYSIYYIIASAFMPWQNCNNTWNTPNCIYNIPTVNCSLGFSALNGTCYNRNNTLIGLWNVTLYTQMTNQTQVLAADEYLNREVLNISSDITITGRIQWRIALSLLAAWLLVFGCLFNGIKSSGKAVYFTAVFPYVCLLILFFRGILLDGAVNGMLLYIVPDIAQLQDPSVWKQAACQIFFSLTTNWGGLITLASYNRFHDNILRDSISICLINCATSIVAGFMIFCYLGYLAKLLNTSVANVANQGMGLAFIVFPEAVARLPGSYVWSALFFIMILTMGLSSQCTTVETSITSFIDCFPDILRPRRRYLLGFACIVLYLLGLPMCTQSGVYWLNLMDSYCGGWAILLIAICEVVSVAWVYGRPGFSWKTPMRFLRDLEIMLQRPMSMWWRICFQYFTPIIMIGVMILSWKDYARATYGNLGYPLWADILGWLMTLFSLVFIPGTIIYLVVKEKKIYPDHTYGQIFYDLSLPTYKWGPFLPKFRMLAAEQLDDSENYYIDVPRRIKYKDIKPIDTEPVLTKC